MTVIRATIISPSKIKIVVTIIIGPILITTVVMTVIIAKTATTNYDLHVHRCIPLYIYVHYIKTNISLHVCSSLSLYIYVCIYI